MRPDTSNCPAGHRACIVIDLRDGSSCASHCNEIMQCLTTPTDCGHPVKELTAVLALPGYMNTRSSNNDRFDVLSNTLTCTSTVDGGRITWSCGFKSMQWRSPLFMRPENVYDIAAALEQRTRFRATLPVQEQHRQRGLDLEACIWALIDVEHGRFLRRPSQPEVSTSPHQV